MSESETEDRRHDHNDYTDVIDHEQHHVRENSASNSNFNKRKHRKHKKSKKSKKAKIRKHCFDEETDKENHDSRVSMSTTKPISREFFNKWLNNNWFHRMILTSLISLN